MPASRRPRRGRLPFTRSAAAIRRALLAATLGVAATFISGCSPNPGDAVVDRLEKELEGLESILDDNGQAEPDALEAWLRTRGPAVSALTREARSARRRMTSSDRAAVARRVDELIKRLSRRAD